MDVDVVTDEAGVESCFAVREAVFVGEQGVPPERELDGRDDAATHFLGRDEAGEPIACARLREHEPGTAKVERVAVVADRRGEGLGRAMMDVVEARARDAGYDEVLLHAQVPVVDFYERLGYAVEGEEFEDAGIPHRRMRKQL